MTDVGRHFLACAAVLLPELSTDFTSLIMTDVGRHFLACAAVPLPLGSQQGRA